MNKFLTHVYQKAKADGRICTRCGWIISVRCWKKGFRLCAGCYDALKGVNVGAPWGKYRDELVDMTGEMT